MTRTAPAPFQIMVAKEASISSSLVAFKTISLTPGDAADFLSLLYFAFELITGIHE